MIRRPRNFSLAVYRAFFHGFRFVLDVNSVVDAVSLKLVLTVMLGSILRDRSLSERARFLLSLLDAAMNNLWQFVSGTQISYLRDSETNSRRGRCTRRDSNKVCQLDALVHNWWPRHMTSNRSVLGRGLVWRDHAHQDRIVSSYCPLISSRFW